MDMIGHGTVVDLMRRNGGSASFMEIEQTMKMFLRSDLNDWELHRLTGDHLAVMVLKIKGIVEGLERNGLIEKIEGDLFTLTDRA